MSTTGLTLNQKNVKYLKKKKQFMDINDHYNDRDSM